MITLLAPLFFFVAAGVAAATVALHFIVTRQPTSSALPTVRFVPKSTVRVVTLDRPRNLLLLLLRVLVVLLIGLAFARPVLVPERRPVARIVLADVSRAVGSIDEVRDSARALLAEGDALVVFAHDARVVVREPADTAAGLERSAQAGRLSAALVAALRAAPELRASADSIEIAIVSAFRAEQADGATQAIRELWPGRIRLVAVAPGADTLAPAAGLAVRAEDEDDGVSLGARLAGLTGPEPGDERVRIVRGEAAEEDSVWAAGGARTLVRWPADGAPPGWIERARPDTAGAVIAGAATEGAAVLVYPLERRWSPAAGGSAGGSTADAGTPAEHGAADPPPWRVAARWVDGEPAAVERPVGAGCLRDVAIPVPERGDLVLRPAFGQLVSALVAPCGAAAVGAALGDEELGALRGTGPLAPRESIEPPEVVSTPLVPWLLALALLLALAELWARRGSGSRASGSRGSPDAEEAAPRASPVRAGARHAPDRLRGGETVVAMNGRVPR